LKINFLYTSVIKRFVSVIALNHFRIVSVRIVSRLLLVSIIDKLLLVAGLAVDAALFAEEDAEGVVTTGSLKFDSFPFMQPMILNRQTTTNTAKPFICFIKFALLKKLEIIMPSDAHSCCR